MQVKVAAYATKMIYSTDVAIFTGRNANKCSFFIIETFRKITGVDEGF